MGDRLRVAVVSEPGKAGVKRHVIDVLSGLNLDRLEILYVYSIARADAQYADEVDALGKRGIRCVEVKMDAPLHPVRDFIAWSRLLRLLREFRPHVLHLHSSKAGGLGRAASLLLWPRPRVIYTPHAMACYRSRTYLKLERLLGRLTTQLIAVSESERSDFRRWLIPGAAKAQVMTMGVATPQPLAHNRPSSFWRIGACGRICYQKNAVLFFTAAVAMVRDFPDVEFLWIGDFGDDAESTHVKRILDDAGNPDRIKVTGWVDNPEAYLATLDTFCMLSRYESFGYVTAEAMLLHVPVVAVPGTGTNDLIRDEQTGLLCSANAGELIKALVRIRADRVLRDRLTVAARQYVTERLTIEKMVAETQQLYEKGAISAS